MPSLITYMSDIPEAISIFEGLETLIATALPQAKADEATAWQQIQPKISTFKADLSKLEEEKGGVMADAEDVLSLIKDAADIAEGLGEALVVVEGSAVWAEVTPVAKQAESLVAGIVGSPTAQAATTPAKS